MELKEIIDLYRNVVIQIATPYSTGTGFYLASSGLIVTNEHVVRDNRRVVVNGKGFDKQLVRVVYLDQKYDLAFLEAPVNAELPTADVRRKPEVAEGDQIFAVGHPFGLKYTTTQGIISNTRHRQRDIDYIQHDAALNPGNSGGPLIDLEGKVVGVNTFIVRNGNNIGFALPAKYLDVALREYMRFSPQTGARCASCNNLVFEGEVRNGYCPHCGTAIVLPSTVQEYQPAGVKQTIEALLEELGYDVELSRKGPSNWEVREGSAQISISYHEQTGLIVGDAFLAVLPKEYIQDLYEYLLRQNYTLEGLTFSIKGRDIILSLLIYDRYLNIETGKTLFGHLFQKADDYDDILVDKYGALWRRK